MIAVTLACLNRLATWLTLRRIRAQAIILLVCLWSAALVDFSNVGLQDRSGNIKFQDFLVFYTSGKLVMQHHSDQLFDPQVQSREIQAVLGRPTQIQLPNMYGPQVGFVFSLFGRMPNKEKTNPTWGPYMLGNWICVGRPRTACISRD